MSRPPLALVAVLMLAGFLLVVTSSATSAANRVEQPRKQVLINQVLAQQATVDKLDDTLTTWRSRVEQSQDAAGRASASRQDQNRHEAQLAEQAGTTALKGSGLVVKLADSDRQPAGNTSFDATRIQDGDIQLVVNALFAAGAEAVAVNDNRVVAVTPIRAAGGVIVVNYRPVTSPYRITAIGARKSDFQKSTIADHFVQWHKKFGLGFSIDTQGSISVPAYVGRVGIDFARTGSANGEN